METTTTANFGDKQYDRIKEVKEFEESKMGVKGLIDSGLTTIPRIFIHPHDTLSTLKLGSQPEPIEIPAIDLSGERPNVVELVAAAAREFGFFMIVNHGIPVELLDRMIGVVKGFHEQSAEEKVKIYSRDLNRPVRFFSNVDLFHAEAASWRDSLYIVMRPGNSPKPDDIPEICRDVVMEWDSEIKRLGERLLGLLGEGLGLSTDRLTEMTFAESRTTVAHYYPYCPQPDLTMGLTPHTDPGILTVLLQNDVGGLQVKYGDRWLDVKPVHGALIINVGDMFQILSNDEYKSVEHRVLANISHEPRLSVPVFFHASAVKEVYGPLPELVTPERPAVYGLFEYREFMRRFFTKELDGKSLINFYKL